MKQGCRQWIGDRITERWREPLSMGWLGWLWEQGNMVVVKKQGCRGGTRLWARERVDEQETELWSNG